MGKIVRVLLVLALVTAVVGYFRSWYTVTRQDEQQYTSITVNIDRQRVRQDLNVAAGKVRWLAGQGPADDAQEPATDGSGQVTQWPE